MRRRGNEGRFSARIKRPDTKGWLVVSRHHTFGAAMRAARAQLPEHEAAVFFSDRKVEDAAEYGEIVRSWILEL